ncbi:hypothetical protein RJ639_040101 [Escallonia herrerae]|uniref:Small auxin up regulated protein n=1 Tax=Escallonia herrerae TaxID=1293975 RepID=A0AA88WLJ6_9ASTE|nr:hypothetical protein RJ639_040101 [Escallonia herrerae]
MVGAKHQHNDPPRLAVSPSLFPLELSSVVSLLKMGIRKITIAHAKQKLQRTISPRNGISTSTDVPKGHFAVYVGKTHKRFVIPVSYLSHPLFQDLLHWAEEEYGFDHPMRGLTFPCSEDYFQNLTSLLNDS